MRISIKLAIFAALFFATPALAGVNQICEQDGSPCGFPWKILVDNTSLTDNADGTYSLSTSVASYISDTAYGAGWDSVTTIAPSKNAVYDQFVTTLAYSGWVDGGAVVALGAAGDTVSIGTTTAGGKLFIDGDADEIQVQIQAHSSQTAVPLVYENSSGTDLWWITAAGGSASAPSSTSAGWLDLYEDSDNGGHKMRHIAAASLAADTTLTWPADDGDDKDFLQTNGSGTLDFVPVTVDICKTIESPVDADVFLLYRASKAMTITATNCIVESATSAVLTWQECDSAGDTCSTIEAMTCDVDGATDAGGVDNAGIDAGDWVRADLGTITGSPGHVTACFTAKDA